MKKALIGVVAGLVGLLVFGCGDEEVDWAKQFLEITNEEAQARLPVERASTDVLLCSTDAECSEAVSALEQNLIPYVQVVDESLVELSSIDAPTGRAQELQRSTDALMQSKKLWAESLLECARTLDEATCLEADARLQTSIRMQSDVLDALEPFLED